MTTNGTSHARLDLTCWFQMQDGAVLSNRALIEREYAWLNEAIRYFGELYISLHDGEVLLLRDNLQTQAPDQHAAISTVINLTNDALGGIVNAVRLMMFGSIPDALSLTRNAFEACCYADLIARQPIHVEDYIAIKRLVDANSQINLAQELRSRGLTANAVMRKLEEFGDNRHGFYARLCNFGSHALPQRVGLRMHRDGSATLAAVSRQKDDPTQQRIWLRNAAIGLMAVTKYGVEILRENFHTWTEGPRDEDWNRLVGEFEAIGP